MTLCEALDEIDVLTDYASLVISLNDYARKISHIYSICEGLVTPSLYRPEMVLIGIRQSTKHYGVFFKINDGISFLCMWSD